MSIAELFLEQSFSPYATFSQIPPTMVGDVLRQQFTRWGRPEVIRVDNGWPWGNWNDLPTAFALWLIGLGIRMHWNDPCCPQQNPKIERSQGTGKRWAIPRNCESVAELQKALDRADENHREYYQLPGGKTRMEMFPELSHSGRQYSATWEQRHWSLKLAEEHIAEYVVVRKVTKEGTIGIYDKRRYVGIQFGGRRIRVQYDLDKKEWLMSDENDCQIRHAPATEINRAEIFKMRFSKKPLDKKEPK